MSTIGSFNPAYSSASAGINQGLAGLDRDAQALANATESGDVGGMADAIVDSLQQKIAVEASAKMMSTLNQTLGSLIDVRV